MELKKCRLCGGSAKQYTHEDRNVIGVSGWISVCYCVMCGIQVSAFDKVDPMKAEQRAAGYWNREIYDGRSKS